MKLEGDRGRKLQEEAGVIDCVEQVSSPCRRHLLIIERMQDGLPRKRSC